jgi:hypothetical protein
MSLSTGALKLDQDLPLKTKYDRSASVSTSDASLNRRHAQLNPKNDVTFTPGGEREIEFIIAGTTSFADFCNMYVTGLFRNDSTNTNPAATTVGAMAKLVAKLDRGGIGALVSEIIVENASTGSTIQRLSRYNVAQALQLQLEDTLGDEYDMRMGDLDGPSNHSITLAKGAGTGSASYTITGRVDGNAASFITQDLTAAASNILTLGPTSPGDLDFAEVGDDISVTFNDATNPYTGKRRIIHVDRSGTNMILYLSGAIGPVVSGTSTAVVVTLFKNGLQQPANVKAMQWDATLYTSTSARKSHRFTWRPNIGFFKQKQYWPLFLHATGIRLRIRLDPDAYKCMFALNHSTTMTTRAPSWDYQLTNVKLMIPMYDFHSSINKQYISAYNSEAGLLFPFKDYTFHSQTLTNAGIGASSISMSVGVRSARTIVTRMTTENLFSSANIISNSNPSLSQHPQLGLQKYQYTSGSNSYPTREIILDDDHFLENRKHLEILTKKKIDKYNVAFNAAQPYNRSSGLGFSLADYDKTKLNYKGAGVGIADSNAGLMVAILSRERDGRFSGLDLSVQPLKLDMTFDAAPATALGTSRIFQSFIEYDSYLLMNREVGQVILF